MYRGAAKKAEDAEKNLRKITRNPKDHGFRRKNWIASLRWLRTLGRRPSDDLPVGLHNTDIGGFLDRSLFTSAAPKEVSCPATLDIVGSNIL